MIYICWLGMNIIMSLLRVANLQPTSMLCEILACVAWVLDVEFFHLIVKLK